MNSTRHSVECFRPLSGSYISQWIWKVTYNFQLYRFRPLSGSYISQLWQAELWEWNLWCFRPLSGSYISQWNCTLTTVTYISRFRPLSGSYISQFFPWILQNSFRKGFRPLSGSYISQWPPFFLGFSLALVSVPYRGATFLNDFSMLFYNAHEEFPSPIGELHFSINHMKSNDTIKKCFRPLSGSYISQYFYRRNCFKSWKVSVPYRGATFLNPEYYQNSQDYNFSFPSPIGELHFSIKKEEHYKSSSIVSVPYRGATFLNTISATPCPVWDE